MIKKETLTSRERVIRALNREPVDRAPIDLGSHPSTGISAFAYWNLREHLGLSTDNIEVFDTVQFLARVDEDILKLFHADLMVLEPPWKKPVNWNPRGKYTFKIPDDMKPEKDSEGDWFVKKGEEKMRMPSNGFFFDGDWISKWGGMNEDECINLYAKEAERICNETEYAVNYVGYSRGPSFEPFFKDMDQAVMMFENPQAVHEENKMRLEKNIAAFKKINKAFGRFIQILSIGNDMGMQNGPMARPEMINEFCGRYYKEFCSYIHDNSDIKIFMHNCGSIRALIPYIIGWGIDILNPVQISADNMNPEELKKEFGDKIIFWGGGCNTQNVLPSKTAKQVSEHVKGLVNIFKQGGGFVFNQVHNIMGDVPPENIISMYKTAYENSFYQQ